MNPRVPGPARTPLAAQDDQRTCTRERRVKALDDTSIRVRSWQVADMPGSVLLVHGSAAHSHWWDHVGPRVRGVGVVAAVDLAGHGHSGRRPRYSQASWAADLACVARTLPGPVHLVGHSLGGFVALSAAPLHDWSSITVLDSPFGGERKDPGPWVERTLRAPHRFRTREMGAEQFTLLPRSTGPTEVAPAVLARVAHFSLRQEGEHWAWCTDPVAALAPWPDIGDYGEVGVRVRLVRAQYGLGQQHHYRRLQRRLGPAATIHELPNAGHHALLDQPEGLLGFLNARLSLGAEAPATALTSIHDTGGRSPGTEYTP